MEINEPARQTISAYAVVVVAAAAAVVDVVVVVVAVPFRAFIYLFCVYSLLAPISVCHFFFLPSPFPWNRPPPIHHPHPLTHTHTHSASAE